MVLIVVGAEVEVAIDAREGEVVASVAVFYAAGFADNDLSVRRHGGESKSVCVCMSYAYGYRVLRARCSYVRQARRAPLTTRHPRGLPCHSP